MDVQVGALVAHPDVRLGLTRHLNAVPGEACLRPKDAARPALAGKAVADRDPDGVARDSRSELAVLPTDRVGSNPVSDFSDVTACR
jgi:hypothetical protein